MGCLLYTSELAKSKGYEFTDEDPQVNYPDELDKYRKEMDDNGWEYGEDEEELGLHKSLSAFSSRPPISLSLINSRAPLPLSVTISY